MHFLKRLIVEIHRRSLWQVVLIYVGGAWGCYEIIDTVTNRLLLPGWLPVFAIVLFLLGLPFVIATAFIREHAPGADAPPVTDRPAQHATTSGPVSPADARLQSELAARRRLLTWRNLGFAFVAVLAVWGAVAAGWLALGGRDEAERSDTLASAVSTTRVAVLPFSVLGSQDVQYLGEGMVDLLSRALDGAGDLRVVDPYALMKFIGTRNGAAIDPESGEVVASRFGAGRYVLGSIVEAGGRLQVNAALYRADGDVEISAEEIADDESQVFDLVNRVARRLLGAGFGAPNARLTRVAAATTDSLSALKAYLEGESAVRQEHFGEAAAAFQRAIEIDSTFALGWYRLAVATIYSPTPTTISAAHAAAQAVRFGERLSQRDRDRLAVLDAFNRGTMLEGERRAQAIISSYPEDMEAWYYLGEFAFHFGPLRAGDISVATQAFQRALELDPDHYVAREHLAWTLSIEHRYDALEANLQRLVELESGSDIPVFSSGILAFLRDGRSAVDALIPQLRSAHASTLRFASFQLALLDEGLPAAVDVARLLNDPSRTDGQRESGRDLQALYEAAQGHLSAADAALGPQEARPPRIYFWSPLELRAALWISPFLPTATTQLQALRRQLMDLDYDTVYAPVSRAYLLSMVDARLGDDAGARRYVSELERYAAGRGTGEPSEIEEWAAAFAKLAAAQLAELHGDADEALRLLEQIEPQGRWALPGGWPPLTLEHERYLRGQALEAVGRDEEALAWYASLGWWYTGVPYTAPASLRRAAIYERLGQPEQAADFYRRFIARWRDCDPDLRPILDEAQQALARLNTTN